MKAITIRIPADLYFWLKENSENECRSMNQEIVKRLKESVEEDIDNSMRFESF